MIQDFDNGTYRAEQKLRRLAGLPRDKQWRRTADFGVSPSVMKILEAQDVVERLQEPDQPVKWRPKV